MDGGLLFCFALIACAALAQVVTRYERKAQHRALMEMPEKPIAAVKGGERVRIKGRAVARGALRTSPISQVECIGCSLTVDRHDGDGDWTRVVDRVDFATFVVADGTGEAVLHAPFELRLAPHDARGNDLPRALIEILALADIPRTNFFGFDHTFRYVETVLLPGDEIVAVGRATIEIDPASRSPSRRDPPVVCHMKGREEAVIIADAKLLVAGVTASG